MSKKALIIFCEGPHDVAYVRMVLSKLLAFEIKRLKFSEMPAPFNSLFSAAMEKHAANDMRLDMAHKFFLPDSVLHLGGKYVFLFNTGGNDNHEKVRLLLSDFISIFNHAKVFPGGAMEIIDKVKYLFTYDCDEVGIDGAVTMVDREYQQIDGCDFITGSWQPCDCANGKTSGNKAIFVWGSDQNIGTLEDILYPLVEEHAGSLFSPALEAIQQIRGNTSLESTSKSSKFKKAVITVAGQKAKPGSSMNVIVEQSGLITEEVLSSCSKTEDFKEFLRSFFCANS